MRRYFLLIVGLLLLVPVFGASVQPDHVLLTWTGDPATTMTISWRTDASVTAGIVQYAPGTAPMQSVAARARDFSTELGASRLFSASLTGLTAKTRYRYRVGDGTHWSDTFSFTTTDPHARAVTFLVFGDSQSIANGAKPYALWRTTVHNAYAATPKAQFLVNVGDLVDTGQSGAHWNAWFAAAAGVIEKIPEMPVVGNHETYGVPGSPRPRYWLAQFPLPQNGPDGLKGQAYSYTVGPVHCVVLDSQQSEQRSTGDIFPPQQRWLDADLAASKAPWKIVFFHKTPYDAKSGRANSAVKAAFCPIIERHHVDLVINGHDHAIARTYPIRNGGYGQRPSQGTIYFIAGRSGTKTYRDVQKQEWNSFFYNPLDQPNYLVIEIVDDTLTVRAVKQDGTPIDTFSIDKTRDIIVDGRTAVPAGAGR